MLMRALTTHGEALSTDDLAQCLRALVGTDTIDDAVGGKNLTAATFAEEVLGFEDYGDAAEGDAE